MTTKPHATRAGIDDVKSGQAAGSTVAPDGA